MAIRVCLLLFALAGSVAHAQPPDGGGPLPSAKFHDEISTEQRARIDRMLLGNAKLLQRAVEPNAPAQANLHWPLRPVPGYVDPGYHGVSNFVDLDVAPSYLLDWNCGARTYDLA